ncbi:MAG: hypothetical protein FVQ77_10240 [Cytophagales bacterium]|nr:hypothetical protein [Cytophagales bacterium]
MRVLILVFSLLFYSIFALPQILKPATWDDPVLSKQDIKVGDVVDIIFRVTIDGNWYLYSTDFDPDLGPMVTTFIFDADKNDSYKLVGGIKAIGSKKKYDEIWHGDYTYFYNKAEFRQTIKVLKQVLIINGAYEYQVCTDVDGKCIPFDDEFTYDKIIVLTIDAMNILENETQKFKSTDIEFISVSGETATGKDGADYIQVKDWWYKVPAGNSINFYRKYINLGGVK